MHGEMGVDNHAGPLGLQRDSGQVGLVHQDEPTGDYPPVDDSGSALAVSTAATASPAADDSFVPGLGGRLGDRYEVLRLMRRGGMGAVYEGRQLGLDRRVAIKTLGAGVLASRVEVERFRREARIIQGLTHPNTIRLYDHGEQDGIPYIVMEYIEGSTLDAVLRTFGKLSIETVVQIGKQVLGSLQEAHAKEITHRDIKPDNLMLCDQVGAPNFVKVLDFGLARVDVERPALETGPGAALGTVHYMAPEQLRGQRATPSSDLYGLALTLFELAVGRPAYTGATAYEIATHHLSDYPLVLPPDLANTRLGEVIAIAASKSPDERFPSAAEMLEALNDTHQRRHRDGDSTGSFRVARRITVEHVPPSVIVDVAAPEPSLTSRTGRIRPVRPRARLSTVGLFALLVLSTAAAALALRLDESARYVEQRQIIPPPSVAQGADPSDGLALTLATGPLAPSQAEAAEDDDAGRAGQEAAKAGVHGALDRAVARELALAPQLPPPVTDVQRGQASSGAPEHQAPEVERSAEPAPVEPARDARPASARPATTRPASARPATTRPASARPATTRPASARRAPPEPEPIPEVASLGDDEPRASAESGDAAAPAGAGSTAPEAPAAQPTPPPTSGFTPNF
jgi:serine/threonine protein kinase